MKYFYYTLLVLAYFWAIAYSFAHINVYLTYLLIIVGIGIIIKLINNKFKK